MSGYIDEYTIQDAIITPKSFDNMIISSEYTDVVYYGILNTYNFKSPNKKDQVLILTSDNKYIVFAFHKDGDIKQRLLEQYHYINLCVTFNVVYLHSDIDSTGEKLKFLWGEKEKMPDYAKKDDKFTKDMEDVTLITDHQEGAVKRINVIIDLLKRNNPDKIDINLVTFFSIMFSNNTIPDTYCFQLNNISSSDPIAEYSCTVKKNASSSLSPLISLSTPPVSNELPGLSLGGAAGILVALMVVLCGGFFLFQYLANKNKSTSNSSSDTSSTEMNRNVSGGYYYYKL